MTARPFFDVAPVAARQADVLLLPLPYEGTVTYGTGTAHGPQAIRVASTHVELWDEEMDFDLDALRYYAVDPLVPGDDEPPSDYLERVFSAGRKLHEHTGLVVGIGGEHSLTPPLVAAAADDPDDLSAVTVVQIDAHADLRDEYDGTRRSHACAMRRVVEKGARAVAIGIRSAERAEFEYGRQSGRVLTFFAQQLAEDAGAERMLLDALAGLQGSVYLTIDLDGLAVTFCPNTGTPQPGGLGWWQTVRYLRCLLSENRAAQLIGCDLVETVPIDNTQINEMSAAKLLAKILAYRFKQS